MLGGYSAQDIVNRIDANWDRDGSDRAISRDFDDWYDSQLLRFSQDQMQREVVIQRVATNLVRLHDEGALDWDMEEEEEPLATAGSTQPAGPKPPPPKPSPFAVPMDVDHEDDWRLPSM